MEITGRIIAVLPERSGISQRSGTEWKAGSYVLETQEQFPRKMCFDVFGADRIQQFNIQVGEMLTVSFDIDAHEYQGRWFNSIRAFRVDRNIQAAPAEGVMPTVAPLPTSAAPVTAAPAPAAAPASAPVPDTTPFGAEGGDDTDLPF